MDEADVGVGLGEVAELSPQGLVVHLREEAQVVALGGDYIVEVVEGAVMLPGVYQVPMSQKLRRVKAPSGWPPSPSSVSSGR